MRAMDTPVACGKHIDECMSRSASRTRTGPEPHRSRTGGSSIRTQRRHACTTRLRRMVRTPRATDTESVASPADLQSTPK
jgi:hypothetical protein